MRVRLASSGMVAPGLSRIGHAERLVHAIKSGAVGKEHVNSALILLQEAYRARMATDLSNPVQRALRKFVTDTIEEARKGYRLIASSIKASPLDIELPAATHMLVWEDAAERAAREATAAIIIEVGAASIITSERVMEEASRLIEPAQSSEKSLARMMQGASDAIRSMVQTSKNILLGVVAKAIAAVKSFVGVAEEVKDQTAKIADNRVGTITRTESTRAANAGVIEASILSRKISHLSVTGCSVIEKKGPTYRGVPTCNIQNVLVDEAPLVSFHPNHTGYFVIAGFFGVSGAPPALQLREGTV